MQIQSSPDLRSFVLPRVVVLDAVPFEFVVGMRARVCVNVHHTEAVETSILLSGLVTLLLLVLSSVSRPPPECRVTEASVTTRFLS